MDSVTEILSAIEQGDTRAADQLFPLVYEALRELAAAKLAQERPGRPCKLPLWSMKPTCGWWKPKRSTGTAAVISLPRPPRRCAAFWWTAHGKNRA